MVACKLEAAVGLRAVTNAAISHGWARGTRLAVKDAMTGFARPAGIALILVAILGSGRHASAGVTERARYEAVLEAGGDWLMAATNDEGLLAWGESYVMMSLVAMYRATGEVTYLDELCRHADRVLASTDQARGVTDYRGESLTCWQATRADYTAEPYCFAVHTGMIASPMVDAAALIIASPDLAAHVTYDRTTLGAKADAYVAAGRAAAAVHADEWRESGADQGYYIFRPDMDFYPQAGQVVPLNMMNAMGLLHIALYQATGDPADLDHARRLANYFAAQLTVATDGGYAWNYRPGSYVAPGEDVSHAALNVDFAVRAATAGIVFDKSDLARMATTFWRVWIDNAHSYDRVGGSGSQNGGRYRMQLGRWAVLAGSDPSIHAAVRDLYATLDTTSSGSLLLAMALLAATDLPVRSFDFYVTDWRDDGDERTTTAANANVTVLPDDVTAPQMFRLRYRSAVPFDVEQYDGDKYHVVAELAATGDAMAVAHIAYRPEFYADYNGRGALFQLSTGAGLVVAEPLPAEPPVFASTPAATVTIGQRYDYAPVIDGPGLLRFSLERPPQLDATFDSSTGEVSFTAPTEGAYQLALEVESDHGSDRQVWTVEITAADDDTGDTDQPPAETTMGGCSSGGAAGGGPPALVLLLLLSVAGRLLSRAKG